MLVGAGIMSATLGALLRLIESDWSITLVERLDGAAPESSGPWNNAGTGHSALCELNYTPERPDGSIDVTKAVAVNEQFQVTRQFWASAVDKGVLTDARSFLHPIPHVAYVRGAQRVDYLRRRRDVLAVNPLFAATEFVDDPAECARRLPLMVRDVSGPIALSWARDGTDVDFGALSAELIAYGVRTGTAALFGHEVRGLRRQADGTWTVTVRNNRTGSRQRINTRFVFVGAGGEALTLLQTAGIAEVKGFGGFPVAGRFLRTTDAEAVAAHRAKVYGDPAPGAPKMAAPHLDARIVAGKPWLVFGPFAGWTPRFSKHGSRQRLPRSVRLGNIGPLASVGLTHLPLINYLVGQVLSSDADRVATLREFAPYATGFDWETIVAGQRVQVIRPVKGNRGVLEFDTTILGAADGSIAGLLGASPGASTAVSAMLDVLQRCFPDRYPVWLPILKDLVPSLGISLSTEPRLFAELWDWGTNVLGLQREVAM